MPPHRVFQGALPEETVARLLDHALAREPEFAPTGLGRDQYAAVDPTVRRSRGLRGLPGFRPAFKALVMERAQALMAELRTTVAEPSSLELQLVAHGEGDFFRKHIDTQVGDDTDQIRVLSGVYYFHRSPKGFEGGALRLYAIGAKERFIDIEPEHNSLVVFPSWAPHEVMPVRCPSGQFADSRFAVNCWVYARRGG